MAKFIAFDFGRFSGAVRGLRSHPLREPFLFGIVGLLNTSVDFGIFFLLVKLGIAPLIANVVSFALGAANSYVLNGRLTFRVDGDAAKPVKSWSRGLRFALVTGLTLLISQAAVAGGLAMRWPPILAKVAAIICTFAFSFTLNKLYVFRTELS